MRKTDTKSMALSDIPVSLPLSSMGRSREAKRVAHWSTIDTSIKLRSDRNIVAAAAASAKLFFLFLTFNRSARRHLHGCALVTNWLARLAP